MERRNFIKTTGLVTAGVGLAGNFAYSNSLQAIQNKLPRWKGFNLLDYFTPDLKGGGRGTTTEDDFKWMADWGFDFVRFPMAYPRYVDFDRSKNITPDDVYKIDEAAVDQVEKIVGLANKHGLQRTHQTESENDAGFEFCASLCRHRF